MGNASSLTDYVKNQYVMHKMRTLLCDAVDDAIHDTDRSRCCPRFKNQTECVRQAAEDWHAMVQMIADNYSDVKSSLAVYCFPLNDNEFHKGHVVCFCTFSIDLCVLMLNRKHRVDVDNVMSYLVESLFSKNPNACTGFLKHASL